VAEAGSSLDSCPLRRIRGLHNNYGVREFRELANLGKKITVCQICTAVSTIIILL
jgi:hypothetical protein